MEYKKLLLIGIDQSIPYLINRFLKEGILPNIAKLIENGVYGEAYSCPPCDTPTNWTTIATGAKTANHGVASFYMHLPGEALDYGMKYRSRSQLSRYCKAEYIWDVADNNGLTPFIMNYPSGWPASFKQGAMSLYSWPIPESLPKMIDHSKSSVLQLKIEDDTIKKPKFKTDLPILKTQLNLSSYRFKNDIPIKIYVFMVNGEERIAFTMDGQNNFLEIGFQNWSEWKSIEINTIYGLLPCIFRIKVLKIDRKTNELEIQRSILYNLKGWTTPESLAEKLIRNAFEYELSEKQEVEFMISGSIEKFLQSAREESITLARSIIFTKKEMNWDLCYFHYHPLDSINHNSLAFLYKDSPLYTEEKAEKTLNYVKSAYNIVDDLVGNLIDGCIDNQTIVVFVSDHGAIPIWKIVNIPLIFSKAGLIKYKWNNIQKKYIVDWENTVAFPYMEPPFVWVNLENRDPNGIVKQKDYEMVRERIIETLHEIRDPDTNEKIIELALKKEEANNYGLNGERIGDVVYFLKPSYGLFDGDLGFLDASFLTKKSFNSSICNPSRRFFGAHAYYLPETNFGQYSISVPLIINGPGIKEGETLKNNAELIDLVPTLAHALKIPRPKNAQGSILHEIFN